MKKALLFTALTALSLNAFALTETDKCRKEVKSQLRNVPSDDPLIIGKGLVLPAGETYEFAYGKTFGPVEVDTILYKYSGSYYSGSFAEMAVVNPQNCKIKTKLGIYSE